MARRDWDASKYITVPDVAVLDEHTVTAEDDRPPELVDVNVLNEIAAHNNARIDRTGDYTPLVVGHTKDGAPETDQPPLVGYADNFRVAPLNRSGKYAIFADLHYRKDCADVIEKYPRRSVELWIERREIDPISLLGATTPERDLGVIRLSRGGHKLRRYSPNGDSTMADTDTLTQPDPEIEKIVAAVTQSDPFKQLEAQVKQIADAVTGAAGGEGGDPSDAEGAAPPPDDAAADPGAGDDMPPSYDDMTSGGGGDDYDPGADAFGGDAGYGQQPMPRPGFEEQEMRAGHGEHPIRYPELYSHMPYEAGFDPRRQYMGYDPEQYMYGHPEQYYANPSASNAYMPGPGPNPRRMQRQPQQRPPQQDDRPRSENPEKVKLQRDKALVELRRSEEARSKLEERVVKLERANRRTTRLADLKQLHAEGVDLDPSEEIDVVEDMNEKQYEHKLHEYKHRYKRAPVNVSRIPGADMPGDEAADAGPAPDHQDIRRQAGEARKLGLSWDEYKNRQNGDAIKTR